MTEKEHQERMASAVHAYIREQQSDFYFFSGQFIGVHEKNAGDRLAEIVLTKANRQPNATLLLTTYGGDPDSAFRVARAIRRAYADGEFRLLVAGPCKSAGTLIALGAHRLVFGLFGELGPLDVQMTKPDELVAGSSGLDIFAALETLGTEMFDQFFDGIQQITEQYQGAISTKMAADIAVRLVTGMITPIAGHIDPMRLGEAQRAIEIAKAYGKVLDSPNLKDNALDELVESYPLHSFVIDSKQARKHFKSVSEVNDEELEIVTLLGTAARYPRLKDPVIADLGALLQPQETANAEPGRGAQDSEATGGGTPAVTENPEHTEDSAPGTASA